MIGSPPGAGIVLDASAMVDLLAGDGATGAIGVILRDSSVHVPAHFDAEVLSAVGRLYRGGHLAVQEATEALGGLQRAPFARHPLAGLIGGAWARRDSLRLVDALYVELAEQLGLDLITTDGRLAKSYSGARFP